MFQLGLHDKAMMVNSPLFDSQVVVNNGLSVRLYQRALDKAFAQVPGFMGNPIHQENLSVVMQSGSADYGPCTFSYELGFRNGAFNVNLDTTSFDFNILPGNVIAGTFNIDATGTVQPYADGAACGLEASGGPTFSAAFLRGSISLTAALENHQIVITGATFVGHFDTFAVDLGPISDVLDFLGLHDELNNFLKEKAEEIANAMISDKLPAVLTTVLRDKLNFSDTIEGVAFAIRPSALATNVDNLTLRMDSTMAAAAPTGCPVADCTEPHWPSPTGLPAESDTVADGAAAVGIGAMSQGVWALWRSGKMALSQTMDAQEVIGALIPGLPVQGQAELKVWTEAAPTITLTDTADAQMHITAVKATVKIAQGPGSQPLNITLQTELDARAILDITPPLVDGVPNPEGNRIQFRMADFVIGTTTAQYGPGSATLTSEEKSKLLELLVLPLYKEKVGTVVLSSSIVDFKLNDNSRAALHVLRKERSGDSIVVYFNFAVSPPSDHIAPTVSIDDVDGLVPNALTHEVMIGDTEAIISYSAHDNLPDFLDYVKFETSLGGTTWTSRDYLPAVKVSDLKEGANWFYVRARDFAQNQSAATGVRITVDTQPPVTTITQAPTTYLNGPNATIQYSATDLGAGVQDYAIAVDGGAMGAFTVQKQQQVTGLGEGPHTVTVHARDKVGHIDMVGSTASFTVDLTPPMSALNGARSGYVKPSTARFAVIGTDNFSQPSQLKFNATLSGPACANASSTFDPMQMVDLTGCVMTDGQYTLQVRAQDQAGNTEMQAATRDFLVDGTPPTVMIMEKPTLKTNDAAPRFVVSGTDNMTDVPNLVYQYRLTGMQEFSPPVSDPVISLEGLPSGEYVFEVTSLDLAENPSLVQLYKFTLDNVSPTTMLREPMAQWSTTLEVPVPVTGTDDMTKSEKLKFNVSIDGGAAKVMSQPLQLLDIAEGRHTLLVRALDEFGNGDPVGVTTTFNVDRTAPDTTLESKPSFIRAGQFRPKVSGTDNLTPTEELRYAYRITRAGKTTEWSEPMAAADFVIPLAETGMIKLELAALDNAGLIDADPVVFEGSVRPASGCACSGAQPTSSEIAWVAALALSVMMLRRRRAL